MNNLAIIQVRVDPRNRSEEELAAGQGRIVVSYIRSARYN